jgi:hypothetical protein
MKRGTPDVDVSGYALDWVVSCESQAQLDPLIRNLIADLRARIA